MATRNEVRRKKPTTDALPGDGTRQGVSNRLRQLAYERGPHVKLPTTRELCELLGTTPRTLGDALDELELHNVIYRKPRNGIFVSPRLHERHIALVLGANHFSERGSSPFWDVLIGHFLREAHQRNRERGESLSLHIAERRENAVASLDDQLVRLIEQGRIDGVLTIGIDDNIYEYLLNTRLPMVGFGGSGLYNVLFDEPEMVRIAAEALLAQGCREIRLLLVGDDSPPVLRDDIYERGYHSATDEREALRSALAKHGLPFREEMVVNNRQRERYPKTHQEQGRECMKRFFGDAAPRQTRPDGLIFNDDVMASGAFPMLRGLGVRVPEDVKAVVQVNRGIPLLDAIAPCLTRLEFDGGAIVRLMYETLDKMLSGETLPDYGVYYRDLAVLPPGG